MRIGICRLRVCRLPADVTNSQTSLRNTWCGGCTFLNLSRMWQLDLSMDEGELFVDFSSFTMVVHTRRSTVFRVRGYFSFYIHST